MRTPVAAGMLPACLRSVQGCLCYDVHVNTYRGVVVIIPVAAGMLPACLRSVQRCLCHDVRVYRLINYKGVFVRTSCCC